MYEVPCVSMPICSLMLLWPAAIHALPTEVQAVSLNTFGVEEMVTNVLR